MRMTQGAVDYRSTADPRAGLLQQPPHGAHRPRRCRAVPAAGHRGAAPCRSRRRGTRPDTPRRRPAEPVRRSGAAPWPRRAPTEPPAARPRAARPPAAPSRRPPPPPTPTSPRTPDDRPRPSSTGRRQPPASVRLADPGRARHLGHALASEWTKIRSVRSTMWTLGVMVVLVVGIGLLVGDRRRHRRRATNERSRCSASASSGCCSASICVITLGVLVITSEYGTGMIRRPSPRARAAAGC